MTHDRSSPPAVFTAGIALSVAVALLMGYALLHPPMADLARLGLQLAVTALLSFVAGYAVFRLGWLNRSPHLTLTLLAGYVIATALTVLNVWVSARLMFLSEHDLLLSTALLVFAGGIAIAFGWLFSWAVTTRLVDLNRLADEVSAGDLSARASVIGRDEVAELAQNLNTMTERLQAAQAAEAEADRTRRELIAWIGHDLRTPLASARAVIEALQDGVVDDPPTVARYLGTAQREIGALARLIDDLGALAELDAGGLQLHPEANSLGDLISEALEGASAVAHDRHVHLVGAVAPDVDPVVMDAPRMARVLDNLLSNAVRHTPDGGRVEVTAERRDGAVRVVVEDSGAGIAPEDVPHVFEGFYRGERSRSRATGGSGLGLAIAKGLVEAHGGTIGLASVVGEGTRVEVNLPG